MDIRDMAKLASCRIFSDVPPRELAASVATLPYSHKTFERDSVILLAGCEYTALHVLIEGEAYAEMTSDDGKVVRVESFRAVDSLAAAILFTPNRSLPVSVVAKTDCRLIVLPRDGLITLCMRHKPILEALLREVGTRMDTLADRLRAAQFISLRERIADWLLRRMELSGGDRVHMEATRERMAELFGVARPSLSRELGYLQKAGILTLSGKEIKILDTHALKAIRNAKTSGARR